MIDEKELDSESDSKNYHREKVNIQVKSKYVNGCPMYLFNFFNLFDLQNPFINNCMQKFASLNTFGIV
jgi:hypothetical protein